jgi:hypothetical protein
MEKPNLDGVEPIHEQNLEQEDDQAGIVTLGPEDFKVCRVC